MTKLQNLRKLNNLSQNDLAVQTGISKKMVQHYEIGYRSIDGAGLDKLVPLAIALNCKISDMLENETLIEQCKQLGI